VLEKARRGVYRTGLRAHRQPPGSSGRPKSVAISMGVHWHARRMRRRP